MVKDPYAVTIVVEGRRASFRPQHDGPVSSEIRVLAPRETAGPQHSTPADLVRTALADVNRTVFGVRVRLEGMTLDARELSDLLGVMRTASKIDLTGCILEGIDLSPENLAALDVDDNLRRGHGIDLSGITLQKTWLQAANLQEACLRSARLNDAQLNQAQLQRTNLVSARLQRATLTHAQLQGADLSEASLERANLAAAVLRDAKLWGANLRSSNLEQAQLANAWLVAADLRGAYLQSADLRGARLNGADLRHAELRTAKSLERVRWHNARLEKTWLYRRQIDPIGDEVAARTEDTTATFQQASEAYLALKTNFLSLGNYEDAAWAYVKEQQMEKMAHYSEWRSHGWRPWRNWRSFLRWLRNWAFELLAGYGERPFMPVLWGAATIAIFTFVFLLAGNVASGEGAAPNHNFANAITHSIAAFATIGFNTLEPVGWGARLLTAVESMLGIGFFALLLYTLGNRMSRS